MEEGQTSDTQQAVPQATISLAGKEYDYASLSEPAKQLVGALRSSEAEIRSLRNQLALMDMGRRALISQLRLALENPEAFARLQTPEADQRDAEAPAQP